MLGVLALRGRARGSLGDHSYDRSSTSLRRSGNGSVRCLVSLTATSGDLDTSLEIASILTRSVAGTMSASEGDVRILAAHSRSSSALDVSFELVAAADTNTVALARQLRSAVEDGKLDTALAAAGLALTAAFRSSPQPFSELGQPEVLRAADHANAALLAGLLVPMLVLLPGLVFIIFHYQLVERFVSFNARQPYIRGGSHVSAHGAQSLSVCWRGTTCMLMRRICLPFMQVHMILVWCCWHSIAVAASARACKTCGARAPPC